jgi:RNA polymerase subunit RPABC4/transcription elongation factor Spt4
MGERFFCENCGAEVKRDAKTCPQCGVSFADILCLSCGFSGNARLFADGCPVCGAPVAGSPVAAGPVNGAPPKPKGGNTNRQNSAAGALPAWAYILALLAFAGILALLLTR